MRAPVNNLNLSYKEVKKEISFTSVSFSNIRPFVSHARFKFTTRNRCKSQPAPDSFCSHSFWRMRLGACTRHFTRQYIIKTMTSLSMLTLLCLYFLYFSLFFYFSFYLNIEVCIHWNTTLESFVDTIVQKFIACGMKLVPTVNTFKDIMHLPSSSNQSNYVWTCYINLVFTKLLISTVLDISNLFEWMAENFNFAYYFYHACVLSYVW